jgi:hypothetical protein
MRDDEHRTLGTRDLYREHERARRLAEAAATDNLEKARAVVAAFWQGQRNAYDGIDVREEASPGNYAFETREGAVKYVYYDARGFGVR